MLEHFAQRPAAPTLLPPVLVGVFPADYAGVFLRRLLPRVLDGQLRMVSEQRPLGLAPDPLVKAIGLRPGRRDGQDEPAHLGVVERVPAVGGRLYLRDHRLREVHPLRHRLTLPSIGLRPKVDPSIPALHRCYIAGVVWEMSGKLAKGYGRRFSRENKAFRKIGHSEESWRNEVGRVYGTEGCRFESYWVYSITPCPSAGPASRDDRAVLVFPPCPGYDRRDPGASGMDPTPFLDRLTDDEGLTRGLDETEAMSLLAALADAFRAIAARSTDAARANRDVEDLCRRVRQLGEVMAAARAGSETEVRELATRHQFTWPEDASGLFEELLRQVVRSG